ncbi:hypothetical protein HDV03_002110 [Kappamyces sp. JEL0829]|nr:hypothetical protein HDV03_002110 [Kappamyces sp. JEL0829]
MIFTSPLSDVTFPTDKSTFDVVFHGGRLAKPSKVALVDGTTGKTTTFKQLYENIVGLSSYLSGSLKMKRGEVLAIYSPNDVQYPMILFAGNRSGLAVTTANPSYLPSEFAYQLQDSRAKVIFCHPSVLKETYEAAAMAKIPRSSIYLIGDRDLDGHTCVATLIAKGLSMPAVAPYPYTKHELLNDPAYLCYSSGTTGRSKGVITTCINIISNIFQHGAMEDKPKDTDTNLAVLPMYHIYALSLFLHNCIYRGETVVVMSKFDLVQFLELIQKYRVTHVNIVPPIAIGLAKHPIVDKYNLTSLKHVLSGAAPLGEDISREFTARLKIPIKQAYGMTETSPLALYTPRRDIVVGTVGILAPNMQAKIIDPSGKLLGYGQEGELCLRGPNVMKGYLNNEKATRETLIDGWLHTGDVAIVQKNGYYRIVDRIKELIKYKGLQVVPAELESHLLGHPKIADAAVIPRPDDQAGEIPKAYCVLKPGQSATEKEIQDYIAGKVSYHKYLRGGVEFIPEIPKSASGKILRRVLREMDKKTLAKL